MKVNLGGNHFFGVPFPLVLADRFFEIFHEGGRMLIDVFRWDEEAGRPIFEVLRSQPQQENISTNPTGIVTVSEPTTGAFQYKFRPKPGASNIFGRIPVSAEFCVRVTDRELEVRRDETPVMTLQRNQFSGFPIGVMVSADGSIGVSVNWLPEGMEAA